MPDVDPVQFVAESDFSDVLRDMDRLRASATTVDAAMSRVGGQTPGLRTFSQQLTQASQRLDMAGAAVSNIGRGLTATVTAPIIGIGAAAIKAAVDWETAWTGVEKTVDALPEDLDKIERGLRDMALAVPKTAEELAAIASLGGQLGVAPENLIEFTRVITDLDESVESLTFETAATSVAQLMNIMGTAAGEIENVSSAIVDLGNKGASTEGDILGMGLRIAGAGKIAGLAEGALLGVAGAFSSAGVEAEAGGTAIQKVLIGMTEAVATGNEDLALFAKTAGLSAKEFREAWADDPAEAFTLFVEGLGRAGSDAFAILDELDLKDQRLIRSFLSVAGAGSLLRDQIEIGTAAYTANVAASEEAARRYATVESQLKILKNTVKDTAITLGEALMPVFLEIVGIIRDRVVPFIKRLVDQFKALPESTRKLVVLGALAAAALGPLALIFGSLLSMGGSVLRLFGLLAGGFGGAATAAGAATGAAGGLFGILGRLKTMILGHPLLLLAGVIAAVVAASPELQAAFGELFTALGKALAPVIDALLPVLQEIIGALVPVVGELVKAFVPLIQALLPALIPLLEALVPIISVVADVLTFLIGLATPVIEFFATFQGGLYELIGAFFSGDFAAIPGIAQRIFGGVGKSLSGLSSAFGDFFGTIGKALGDFFGFFAEGWQQIVDFFGRVGDEIGRRFAAVGAFFGRVGDEIAAAWGRLVDGVKAVIGPIIGIVIIWWQTLQGIFKAGVELLTGIWNKAWGFIKDVLGPIFATISGVVGGAIENIRNVITTVMGTVKRVWETVWNAVRTVVQTVVDKVKSIILGVRTAIDSFVSFFRNGINKIKGFFEGLIAPIKRVVDRVVGFINQINPFHRGSPSLVDNVQQGVQEIIAAYRRLSGLQVDGPTIGQPTFDQAGVATEIENYLRFLVESGDPLNDFLTHLPEGIRESVLNLGERLEAVLEGVSGDDRENLRRYLGMIVEEGAGQGDFLNDWLTHLPAELQPIAQAVGAEVARLQETLGKAGTLNEVESAVDSCCVSTSEGLSTVAEGVDSVGSSLSSAIGDAADQISDTITTSSEETQEALTSAVLDVASRMTQAREAPVPGPFADAMKRFTAAREAERRDLGRQMEQLFTQDREAPIPRALADALKRFTDSREAERRDLSRQMQLLFTQAREAPIPPALANAMMALTGAREGVTRPNLSNLFTQAREAPPTVEPFRSVDAITGDTYVVHNPVARETEESLRDIALRRTYLGANGTAGTGAGTDDPNRSPTII